MAGPLRRLAVATAAAVAAAGLAAGTAQGGPVPRTSHLVSDRQLGCDGAIAAGVRRSLETDDTGEVLALRVRVLLNGTSLLRAQEVFRLVAEGYDRAGIAIQPSFETVRFASRDPQGLMKEAKTYFGGGPPDGTDAVYVYSAVSEVTPGSKVGMVDCLGGMQWAKHAFAAGPEWTIQEYGGWRTGTLHPLDPAALIAAHEIGHLLNAVHEYGDCADVANQRPCDLMWDKVLPLPFISFRFSDLNESIVRSTARAVIASRTP